MSISKIRPTIEERMEPILKFIANCNELNSSHPEWFTNDPEFKEMEDMAHELVLNEFSVVVPENPDHVLMERIKVVQDLIDEGDETGENVDCFKRDRDELVETVLQNFETVKEADIEDY